MPPEFSSGGRVVGQIHARGSCPFRPGLLPVRGTRHSRHGLAEALKPPGRHFLAGADVPDEAGQATSQRLGNINGILGDRHSRTAGAGGPAETTVEARRSRPAICFACSATSLRSRWFSCLSRSRGARVVHAGPEYNGVEILAEMRWR